MADGSPAQPKKPDKASMEVEALALKLLDGVLPKSLTAPRREYGGVIHRHKTTGKLGNTGPFEGVPGENTVDVHANKPNLDCPDGTVPVAWYHTHPYADSGGVKLDPYAFEDGDAFISYFNQIPGFFAAYDGTFWRYDPAPGPKPDEPLVLDGSPLPKQGPGTTVKLNHRLKTR